MTLSTPHDYYERSPVAIAHRRIILDQNGNPCDYLFLDVNEAYGLLHGLPKKRIIGKRLSEIYPNMQTEESGWIERYGKLAALPGRLEFEQSSVLLDAWYRVVAISDGSGEFISFSTDITAEKMVTQTSETLMQTGDSLDMQKITEQLRLLSGAKYAVYNQMDEGGKTVTTRAASADEQRLAQAVKILGFELIGKKWGITHSREKMITAGTKIQHFSALHQLMGKQHSPVFQFIEERFQLGNVYVLQIMKNDVLLGDFNLIMMKDRLICNQNLVEIFVRQVGLALDRNQKEMALRNQSALLNGLLDSIPDTIFYKNPDSVYLGCNKRFETYVGRNRAEIIGKTDEELFEPKRAKTFREHDRLMFQKREPHHCEEVDMDAEGNRKWYDTVKVPLHDENGVFIGLVGYSHDITKIRLAEAELRDSEERFRQLVELSPDAILVHADEKYVYLNQAAVKLMGASSAEELSGKLIYDRLHPENHLQVRERMRLFETSVSTASRNELTLVRMDGTPVEIESNAVPINIHGQNGTLVYIRDISERKKADKEKQERSIRQRQQQKMESVGTLASGVAHEINNPITGMINYAQLILDQEEASSDKAHYAREIIAEGERVAAIIRDLLDFSRQEGKASSKVKPDELILHTLSLMKSMLQKDGITVHTDISADLPGIRCRSQQIRQVVMNLLNNARESLNEKYTGYHELKKIRINCHLLRINNKNQLCVMIEDSGTGIQENVQGQIYDPFFTTKPREKYVGLGLTVSYGIVEEHGGTLNFETEPGNYTRFYFELPIEND
jgi:PAS domain S-box-containing protein